ncbi:MAG: hypothetical protein A3D92_08155 [Bacteroidetes bacterium RIFCSPHIGHO2_02_FULL_44_7]|nr:MAG: hypothetical protein A3D92_08155 [Bacteroidetes bacterium RIFCSPHIGHO2_02_FULL_44_7]
MLGIILLAVVSIWIWVGNGRGALFKIILSAVIVGGYVLFLQNQGASQDEILEILFSFDL